MLPTKKLAASKKKLNSKYVLKVNIKYTFRFNSFAKIKRRVYIKKNGNNIKSYKFQHWKIFGKKLRHLT